MVDELWAMSKNSPSNGTSQEEWTTEKENPNGDGCSEVKKIKSMMEALGDGKIGSPRERHTQLKSSVS